MVILIKTLQVILALSILIIVHEFGHFIWAKIFGIRVEKFYLFFDVKGLALLKWHWRGTEFGIGLLPFGGYCKISGMIDESMDLNDLGSAPQPWEFRSHSAWQRLLVIAGGVVNNVIFAFLAYAAILAIWGQSYISNTGNRVYVSELAYDMGFRNGDQILRFDDYQPDNFGMLQADLARRDVQMATILRDGDTLQIYIDQSKISDILRSGQMFDLAVPFVIDSVATTSPNSGAGLRRGDRVISINSQDVAYVQDSRKLLSALTGQSATVGVVRGSDTLQVDVAVDTVGRIGVYLQSPAITTRHYNFLSAIPAGIKQTGKMIGGYLQDLKLLSKPSTGAYKSVGSFIAIGQVFPATWDWYQFLNIVALLSIMLAVMNLLPIPALDGGHLIFIIYEMVTGRKPSDRFLAVAQIIGMFLLFALMILAFGNDIARIL